MICFVSQDEKSLKVFIQYLEIFNRLTPEHNVLPCTEDGMCEQALLMRLFDVCTHGVLVQPLYK